MDNILEELLRLKGHYDYQKDIFEIQIPWGEDNEVETILDNLIEMCTPIKEEYMLYPATLLESSEGISLTFKDFPNVTVESSTIDDLLFQASMSLSFSIQGLIESGERRPNPSKISHGDIAIYYHIGK